MRDKVKTLEEHLKQYQDFEGSSQNLGSILKLTQDFIANQGNPDRKAGKMDGLRLFAPLDQADFSQTENPQQVQDTIKFLTRYIERVNTQVQDMERQVEQENQKIE